VRPAEHDRYARGAEPVRQRVSSGGVEGVDGEADYVEAAGAHGHGFAGFVHEAHLMRVAERRYDAEGERMDGVLVRLDLAALTESVPGGLDEQHAEWRRHGAGDD
jgi:hypothetical protein